MSFTADHTPGSEYNSGMQNAVETYLNTVETSLAALDVGSDVQAYDADLAAIAALSPANDDFVQRKSAAWTNRTVAQVKTDLQIRGTASATNTTSWTIALTGQHMYAENTGLTGNLTINNPTGSPTAGDTLWVGVVGTASRTIAHGSEFEASGGQALPTTTSGTTRLDIGYVRTGASKWRCVASI